MYKPPFSRRHADLQWRILQGGVATNSFLSVLNPAVEDGCPFCGVRETLFHVFRDCPRLLPLFVLLRTLFSGCGQVFSQQVFILGFRYNRRTKASCRLLNFVLGTAKMAVYVSRRRKVSEDRDVDPRLLLVNMLKARLLLEFHFYAHNGDWSAFQQVWCADGVLCSVEDGTLLFSPLLA